MKKINVKRLVYIDGHGHESIGGHEYFATLSDKTILDGIHEVGKTQWIGSQLWIMFRGIPYYRVTVQTFTQYQKSWYDLVLDALRRI